MLDSKTTMGAVTLKVQNLSLMTDFYRAIVGLPVRQSSADCVELGFEATLVRLRPMTDGRFMSQATGLYHLALRVPGRADLGHWLRHFAERDAPHWQGASDHGVSEALYLSDPEGNGIEIYFDRPQSRWPHDPDGRLVLYTRQLNLDHLLGSAPAVPWEQLSSETLMGHVHLRINDIEAARTFYTELCGFDLKTTYGDSAIFIAAGDYHHHVGLNTWQTAGAPPLPGDGYGLETFEVVLADVEESEKLETRLRAVDHPYKKSNHALLVTDPAGIAIRFMGV